MDSGRASDLNFERWYRREHPLVVTALAVAGGDVEIAREATDEAFVRAFERWAKVATMESPGGWLYRVALNELRRKTRRRTLERDLLRRQPSHEAVEGPPPIADPQVWDAVRALPRRQRSAVALRYVLDLTEREVAATMGISRGAVSASLTSARRTLQETLGEAVFEDATVEDATVEDATVEGAVLDETTPESPEVVPPGPELIALPNRTTDKAAIDG